MTQSTIPQETGKSKRHNGVSIIFHDTSWPQIYYKKVHVNDKNAESIYLTKGTVTKLLNTKKHDACSCLGNLELEIQDNNKLFFKFDSIAFDCYMRRPYMDDVRTCIRKMRNGKCPYKIAKTLFPNVYKGKEK